MPHAHVNELRHKHEAACNQAGYKVCQVVSTSYSDGAHDDAVGKLEMRAAPARLPGAEPPGYTYEPADLRSRTLPAAQRLTMNACAVGDAITDSGRSAMNSSIAFAVPGL